MKAAERWSDPLVFGSEEKAEFRGERERHVTLEPPADYWDATEAQVTAERAADLAVARAMNP